MSEVRILEGDCVEQMRAMEDASVHAVCTDPPYGLEFMAAGWDKLDGDAWRSGAGFSSPGIGDRPTQWASFGQGDSANATCQECGGRMRGARRCECAEPRWVVKGKPISDADVDSRRAQGRKMQEWHEVWLAECLRVLKPGGFLLAFGGTRTYHRLAAAAEDVGFEVRDMIEWFYGSGFPKSKNVSFAIDEHLGRAGEREVVGQKHAERYPNGPGGTSFTVNGEGADGSRTAERTLETRAATEEAARFEGWGTALKPAHEPILLARKPLAGTVAANFLEHGVGGLNIDAARIATGDDLNGGTYSENATLREQMWGAEAGNSWRRGEAGEFEQPSGRWPANVVLSHGFGCVLVGTRVVKNDGHFPDGSKPSAFQGVGYEGREGWYMGEEVVELYECEPGCPIAELDRQSGVVGAAAPVKGTEPSGAFSGSVYGTMARAGGAFYDDTGGASRFFYVAKASRAERSAGLGGEFEEQPLNWSSGERNPGSFQAEGTKREARNHHPTVKPISLMRHLLRLVVPPEGVALDPFLGSGTTACAAALEGVSLVGIEREPDFCRIARARHDFWQRHGEGALDVMRRRESAERQREVAAEAGQLDLLSSP